MVEVIIGRLSASAESSFRFPFLCIPCVSWLRTLWDRLAFGRHDERIEGPLPVGGLVHRLDLQPEVNPLLWLGQ
jgi:hypothetical protein